MSSRVHYELSRRHRTKLNVRKTFRRRPGCLLNVLCTFNSRPVSAGCRKVINYISDNEDDTIININANKSETNENVSNNDMSTVQTKPSSKGTCLVTRNSILGHVDEAQISRKINAKAQYFSEAKPKIFH